MQYHKASPEWLCPLAADKVVAGLLPKDALEVLVLVDSNHVCTAAVQVSVLLASTS